MEDFKIDGEGSRVEMEETFSYLNHCITEEQSHPHHPYVATQLQWRDAQMVENDMLNKGFIKQASVRNF